MQAFARGYGMAWRYQTQEAIEAFDEAIDGGPVVRERVTTSAATRISTWPSTTSAWTPRPRRTELDQRGRGPRVRARAGMDDKNVNWNLGFVYYLTGDYDEAIAADERALDEDPTLFPVICNLGVTHLAAGDIDEAREALRLRPRPVIEQVTVAKKAGREPPSSLWLYLDLCVRHRQPAGTARPGPRAAGPRRPRATRSTDSDELRPRSTG